MSIQNDVASLASWADVASAIVGAPSGFKLFRYSPLGWARHQSGPLAQLNTPITLKETRFQTTMKWSCPIIWFSLYTPCSQNYEIKYCRKVLTNSTVEAVDRAFGRQQLNNNNNQGQRRRDRGQGSMNTNFPSSPSFAQCPSQSSTSSTLSESSKKQVYNLAYQMASDQQFWMLRIVAYIATKLLNWLFGIDLYIDETGVQCVKKLQKTHTLIYTPSHKSHLDSVLMGYVMFANGLEPAHIVAGDNLLLPIISHMMRASGAFFIRRSNKEVKDREIYKKTLAAYIEVLLSHGQHLEFFIEGGRSRDGSILEPKLGILAYIVDAFIDADLPKDGNVAIVPVNISYDHPIEENGLIHELLGNHKKRETLWGLLYTLFKLLLKCLWKPDTAPGVGGYSGCATVAFGKPLHLKMLLRSLSRCVKGNRHGTYRTRLFKGLNATCNTSRNDLIKAAFPYGSEQRYKAITSIGNAVHSQLKSIQVIPASSILYCAIYLESFRKSSIGRLVTMEQVMKSVNYLQKVIKSHGGQVMEFSSENRRSTTKRIAGFLQRLVNWIDQREDGQLSVKPVRSSSIVFYLRSNHLLLKLAPVCLVVSAVIGCLQGFGQTNDAAVYQCKTFTAPRQSDFISVPYVRRASVIAAALWIREILSPELDLVFGEEGFRTQAEIQDCIDRMVNDEMLTFCIPASTTPAEFRPSTSINSSVASGSRRRSVDHVVDKLIFNVVEDMEVCHRTSIQFESDLKKRKDGQAQGYVSTLPRLQPIDTPTQAADEIFLNISESKSLKIAENLALQGGSDIYSLVYSPLIATYEFLFGHILHLFQIKDYYEEKELINKLLEGLNTYWKAVPEGTEVPLNQNLCWNPIPCLTIVQRFVASLKTWKSPKEDFPFSPYPMLISGSQLTVASRPPRPSFSNDSMTRRNVSEIPVAMASDCEATEIVSYRDERSMKHLQLRREFREGHGITDYQEKLSVFIPSQNTYFV